MEKFREFVGLSWDQAREVRDHQIEKGLAKEAEVIQLKPAQPKWGVPAEYGVLAIMAADN